MATHSKKVSKQIQSMYQVFTNDTSATGAVTFATGDYIDFKASLGRAARNVKIKLEGTVVVELLFNTVARTSSFNESEANTTITMPEDTVNLNCLRLFSSGTQVQFDLPADFNVENIKLVSYSGAPSGTQSLTIIGF